MGLNWGVGDETRVKHMRVIRVRNKSSQILTKTVKNTEIRAHLTHLEAADG